MASTRGGPSGLLFVTVPTLGLLLLALEGAFRFAIPAAEVPFSVYDARHGVLRLDPDAVPVGVYSMGLLATHRARWRVNAAGWNSDIEYRPPDRRAAPLVAILGDSYVQGLHVDLADHVATRLRRALTPHHEVYSFGKAGAPLSQYLQMSRYVTSVYDPEVLVFVVVHNDLHESLAGTTSSPFLTLRPAGDTFVPVPPHPHRPSRPRRLVARSALFRYVWLNAGLAVFVARLGGAPATTPQLGPELRETSRAATHWLLRQIARENPDRRLVFLMDGPRRDIYAGRLAQSPLLWMNRAVESAARAVGADFIDLTARMQEAHALRGERFEFELDDHWDARGHALAAEALNEHLTRDGSYATLRPR